VEGVTGGAGLMEWFFQRKDCKVRRKRRKRRRRRRRRSFMLYI